MDVQIACICPPTASGEPRHESDSITLRDRLDFRAALRIKKAVALVPLDDGSGTRGPAVLAAMSEWYIREGVEAWTCVDEKGKPVPVDLARIFESPDLDLVVDAADALYAEAVLLPLLQRTSRSLQRSPTEASTSPTNGTTTPPTPSSQSSTSTSPTADIVTITTRHDGGSRSSRSSTTDDESGRRQSMRIAG